MALFNSYVFVGLNRNAAAKTAPGGMRGPPNTARESRATAPPVGGQRDFYLGGESSPRQFPGKPKLAPYGVHGQKNLGGGFASKVYCCMHVSIDFTNLSIHCKVLLIIVIVNFNVED